MKLKTLKEIKIPSLRNVGDGHDKFAQEGFMECNKRLRIYLRQEAIKWIKWYKEHIGQGCDRYETAAVIGAFKTFFNITEEEKNATA